jgi:hypothetical protein
MVTVAVKRLAQRVCGGTSLVPRKKASLAKRPWMLNAILSSHEWRRDCPSPNDTRQVVWGEECEATHTTRRREAEGSPPARLTLMVMRSPAYMASGSSSVAPSGYAGVGAAGDTSASTCATHSCSSSRHAPVNNPRPPPASHRGGARGLATEDAGHRGCRGKPVHLSLNCSLSASCMDDDAWHAQCWYGRAGARGGRTGCCWRSTLSRGFSFFTDCISLHRGVDVGRAAERFPRVLRRWALCVGRMPSHRRCAAAIGTYLLQCGGHLIPHQRAHLPRIISPGGSVAPRTQLVHAIRGASPPCASRQPNRRRALGATEPAIH